MDLVKMLLGTSTGGGRPRDERCNSAILKAFLELLVKVGYDNISIDKIAALAKVGKATIYRRWANKDAIVAEFIRSISADADREDDLLVLGDDLHDNILHAVTHLCEVISQTDGAIVSGLIRAMQTDDNLAELIRKNLIEIHMKPIEQAVAKAKDAGQITPETDLTCVYKTILSAILARLLVTKGELDKAFVSDLVEDVVMPLIAYHSLKAQQN